MPQDLSHLPWPIRTARLTIRTATPADLEATWRIRRIPEVSHWLATADRDRGGYATRFLDPDRLSKTLVVELDATVIGEVMLSLEDAWAQVEVEDLARGVQAELGWVLAPEHTGRGYATEAVRALLRTCFEDLGLRRVVAQCFADNTASWRLMERLGMRREDHAVRESLHRSGEWLDGLRYAMLADEWRAGGPGGEGPVLTPGGRG